MPAFVFNTLAGPIHYQLVRRAHIWHYSFYWQNVRYRESTKNFDLGKAKGATEDEILRIIRTQALDGKVLLLKDAVAQYLAARWPVESERKGNLTYIDHNKRLAKFIAGARGETNMAVIPVEDAVALVQEYLNARGLSVGAQSINNDRRVLSRFCAWLMEAPPKVSWTRNPAAAKAITTPRLIRQIKPPADEATAMRMLRASRSTPVFPVLVLMQSGLRAIGCARVLWSGIHLAGKPTIEVPQEKGANRIIPLSAWAARELKAWKKRAGVQSDEQRVYPYTPESAHRTIRKLRQSLGITAQLTQNALRRLSFKRLFQAGVKPQLAARIMGSSVQTAMRHYVDMETLTAHAEVEALSPVKRTQKRTQRKTRHKARSRKSGKRTA